MMESELFKRALTLKICAIFCCWGNEQRFSIDRMRGNGDVTKAARLIASTTD